jgi:hypothetical protein
MNTVFDDFEYQEIINTKDDLLTQLDGHKKIIEDASAAIEAALQAIEEANETLKEFNAEIVEAKRAKQGRQ